MRFGLTLPIFDHLADPSLLADLAAEAEQAGWDAVFVWDHLRYRAPAQSATDPWIAMAAMASRTERVLLGPMVTPLARRRPQIVARQLVALDHLSNGRMVFGVGLGLDTSGEEFVGFGEEPDLRRRAAILDESLEVLTALIAGDQVDHHGEHVTMSGVRFLPAAVQPRLPIWVAIAAVAATRTNGLDGYDVIVNDAAGADAQPWADAGATWLLTRFDPFTVDVAEVRTVIARGPSG